MLYMIDADLTELFWVATDNHPRFLLQLRLCRRSHSSLANRQAAATPYPSLYLPPAALGLEALT